MGHRGDSVRKGFPGRPPNRTSPRCFHLDHFSASLRFNYDAAPACFSSSSAYLSLGDPAQVCLGPARPTVTPASADNPFESFVRNLLAWTPASAGCPNRITKGEISMSDSLIVISEDEFVSQYPLRPEPPQSQCLLELRWRRRVFSRPSGKEMELVPATGLATVWTLVEDGRGRRVHFKWFPRREPYGLPGE